MNSFLTINGMRVEIVVDSEPIKRIKRYKIHVGDRVKLIKNFPSIEHGISGLKDAGVKRFRDAGWKADRCETFEVKDAHFNGRNSLYILESRDGNFCGEWPSYALEVVERGDG